MAQLTTMGSLENEALKSVSHEDKEVGGERVTLGGARAYIESNYPVCH